MIVRAALAVLLTTFLTACVTTDDQGNPVKTDEGREEAVVAYIQLGIGYLQSGDAERAKAPLQKALDLDPSNSDANAALALVFQTEMEPQLAEQYYRKALAESPDDSRIRNNYGSFLFEQERYKEAYESFEKAAADTMYSERSRVFANLGRAAVKLNQPQIAKKHFEKSLRLNRRQPAVLLELAQISFDEKMYVPARDYYQRYSKMVNEQDARALLLGIRLANIFEDRDTAASYGLQLKRLYPGSPEYRQYQSEQ